jgi:hypothetical protein
MDSQKRLCFDSNGPFEVILLSEVRSKTEVIKFDGYVNSFYAGKYSGQRLYYNILLIEWNGGIAERRGFGHIFQQSIEYSLRPGPVWKEISLA